jgi:hypothetical protein
VLSDTPNILSLGEHAAALPEYEKDADCLRSDEKLTAP